MELLTRKKKIIQTLSNCDNIADAKKHYESLQQYTKQFAENPNKQFLCTVLDGLGNKDRILILDSLAETDRCVCEIEAILNKAQSTVSHHLRILEESGLIRGWKKGKFTHYSLIKPRFQEFLKEINQWVEKVRNWSPS